MAVRLTRQGFLIFLEAAKPLGDSFVADLTVLRDTALRFKDLEACEGKKRALQSFIDWMGTASTCLSSPEESWEKFFKECDGRPLPKAPPATFVQCQTSCCIDGCFADRVHQHYECETGDGRISLMPALWKLYTDMVAAVQVLDYDVFHSHDHGVGALCQDVKMVLKDGIVLLDGIYNFKIDL